MRVAVDELVPVAEPQMSVRHEQTLAMFLRPGSIELGFRRSEMASLAYDAGAMFLCPVMRKGGFEQTTNPTF